jgi:hypothetical protein
MKGVLRIFRKDVRRLWPRILLVVGIETLGQSVHPWAHNSAQVNLLNIEMLAQWYLIASAIHEERLVGDRQYWLTKPISRRALVAAKALFILIFIHLPVFVMSAESLMVRGESPAAHWAGLAMVQFSTLFVVLTGAAAAAVSASLVQLVGVLFGCFYGPVVIVLLLGSRYLGRGNLNWGGVEWLHVAMEFAFPITVSSAILVLQCFTRRTWLSRCLMGAAAVAASTAFWWPGWHAAFAIQSRLDGRAPDSVARLVQDAQRGGESAPLPRFAWFGDPSAVEVPILVTGVPPGMAVWSDRIAATGVLADGSVWNSGWDSLNRLSNVTVSGTTTREERMLPGTDTWLYLNVDPNLVGRAIHATVALTLLSAEEVTPLPPGGRPTRVSGGGICSFAGWRNTSVSCSWPSPAPAYAAIRIRSSGSMASPDIAFLNVESLVASYGPWSSSGGLWQSAGTSFESDESSEVSLVTRRAVAHFEREIDIHPAGGGQLR